jgi:hypothetical protein
MIHPGPRYSTFTVMRYDDGRDALPCVSDIRAHLHLRVCNYLILLTGISGYKHCHYA